MKYTKLLFSSALTLTLICVKPSYALFGIGDSNAKLKALYEMQVALNELQRFVRIGNTQVNKIEPIKALMGGFQQTTATLEAILKTAQEEIQAPAQKEIIELQQQLKDKNAKVKELEEIIKYKRENLTAIDDLEKILSKEKTIGSKIVEVAKSAVWDDTLDSQINTLKKQIDDLESKLEQRVKAYRQLLTSNEFYKKRVNAGLTNGDKEISRLIDKINILKKKLPDYSKKIKEAKDSINSTAAKGEEQMKLVDRLAKSAGCSFIKNKNQATQTNIGACMLAELQKKKIDTLQKNEICKREIIVSQKVMKKQAGKMVETLASQVNTSASFISLADCTASLLGKPQLPRP